MVKKCYTRLQEGSYRLNYFEDNYDQSLKQAQSLFKEVQKDFPHLTEADVRIHKLLSRETAYCAGALSVEFNVQSVDLSKYEPMRR